MLALARPALAPAPGAAAPPYPLTPAFLAATVVYLCRSRAFWSRVGSWVDPGAIPNAGARLLVLAARAIADDIGHGPEGTAHVLQRIRGWVDNGTHTAADYRDACSTLEAIDDASDRGELPSEDAVLTELIPELKRRANREALVEANLLAASGRTEELATVGAKLDATAGIGAALDDLGDGLDDAEAALASVRGRPHCPLGVDEVDALLNGGPHLGSFSLWGAGTGGSKSTAMVHLACSAALLGESALIIATEMETPEYWARILANLSGVPVNAVRADSTKARVIVARMRAQMGDIRVVKAPDGETTVADVHSLHTRTEERFGKRYNFLAVDGFDGLTHRRWKPAEGTNRLGQLVGVELDALATGSFGRGGHPIYLHVTSQLQRGKKWSEAAADGTPVPGKDDFADSQYRARKAHYVFTNTVKNDPDTGRSNLYLHVAKSRFSGSAIVFGPMESDLGTGRLVMPVAAPAPPGELPFA